MVYHNLSKLLLNEITVLELFSSKGKLFHVSTDLTLQKFVLMSRHLVVAGFAMFQGSLDIRVTAPELLNGVNQVSGFTSSFSCRVFQTWIMSPLVLLSLRLVRPTSFKRSGYVLPLSPEHILTALSWTDSSRSWSAFVHGDHAWIQYSRWGLQYCW